MTFNHVGMILAVLLILPLVIGAWAMLFALIHHLWSQR